MYDLTGNTLGKYTLTAKLGSGGMATVYRAQQAGLHAEVALKILHERLAEDEQFINRFEREAAALARLNHPNIVRIYDFDTVDGLYYMAMALVDGPTLKTELAQRKQQARPFRIGQAAQILANLLDAVGYAHQRGTIHRDIKPANVMISSLGQAMLTDFGIAYMLGATAQTATGGFSGTPEYMSPEQASGEAVDARSDLYALGLLLYELITGAAPFSGDTPIATLMSRLQRDPIPPGAHVPGLHPAIEMVMLRALARDPNQRYGSAAEFLGGLQDSLKAAGLQLERVDPLAPVLPPLETQTGLASAPPTRGQVSTLRERTSTYTPTRLILPRNFKLNAPFQPMGDQPEAIRSLVEGVKANKRNQVLLGATGTGKTYTMANVIAQLNMPALVMAHNKTLAAQLYAEFKDFFPENAVHFFVSYYDYYQPEAYVPQRDLYIEKESTINEEIDRLRLAATTALMSRRDVVIVASVSCIYGLGSPEAYGKVVIRLKHGEIYRRNALLRQLVESQYQRNDVDLRPGTFRVRGDTLEIAPAYEERQVYRISFFGDEVERLMILDSVSGEVIEQPDELFVYPAKHFITEQEKLAQAIADIEAEARSRVDELKAAEKLLEAQRIQQRTAYDLEMLREVGYCSGIENYSRHLDQRPAGSPPWTLMDYLPSDYLLFIDESHMTIPQVRGMYHGDRSRKTTLVDYGFRLPSALDNRPLKFDEFEQRMGYTIYTSATPGPYEMQRKDNLTEQIIRPTGLVDPQVEIRPTDGQIDDLLGELRTRIGRGERALVTTLTKRMAEKLADYLQEMGIKVHYLHSEVDTLERISILRDLRLGVYDVVVGINLLREGLDLPEVSLVAILDADKEGFLRSETALIQTIGRAARHVNGQVIMYADKVTDSMQRAISETERRRAKQMAYNQAHGIIPAGIFKAVRDLTDQLSASPAHAVAENKPSYRARGQALPRAEIETLLAGLEEKMRAAAQALEFEQAAALRDQMFELRGLLAEADALQPKRRK
ncbi:MAG: hypothetical protein OHK0052_07540 [Anaerolineales bacterium]